MSKIYFEMNGTERQLHHISDGLDYAICVFGEGLSGEFKGFTTNMLIELQDNIVQHLLKADQAIKLLLQAATEDDNKASQHITDSGLLDDFEQFIFNRCEKALLEDEEYMKLENSKEFDSDKLQAEGEAICYKKGFNDALNICRSEVLNKGVSHER